MSNTSDNIVKIAVIEDDAPIRNMYSTKFQNYGFDVQAAEDGEKGLALIEEFKPDLILLDLRMPVMSGDVMLRKLRSHDWGENVLVVVLTNISQSEAPMDLRLLRVEKYIVKAHHTPQQVLDDTLNILRRYNKLPA